MSGNVLIVDDSELVRAMARDALQNAGFKVYDAENGIEANKFVYSTDTRPDVILMDVMMPMLAGNRKAQILKQSEYSKNIPILFISSKSEDELRKLVADTGADGFIRKPFTAPELVRSVRDVLASSGRLPTQVAVDSCAA